MLTQLEPSASRCAASADPCARAAPEVSGILVRVLADVALRYDVTPAALFQRDAERFIASEPMQLRIPLPEYRALIARAIALTGDAALGLRCGLTASDAAFDLFAPLVSHVQSLRHAIRETSQFCALVVDGATFHMSEGAGVARLWWQMPYVDGATDRFVAELGAAGIVRLLRNFGAARSDVRAVRFRHTRPAQHRAYAEVFQGTEQFGCDQPGVELASSLLDRPHLHANPSLQLVMHARAEERLAQLARPADLVSRLRSLLLHRPAAHVPDMTVAARHLGVSVRSLRRRLSDDGISYRALTQDLQHERACMLLRNPELTLQAVADTLGFSELVAFHRAFKRWSGMTPGEYRSAAG